MAAETRKAADEVLGPELMHLEELPVVDDALDDAAHVVRLRRLVRDDGIELRVLTSDGVTRLEVRRRVDVVLGQEREQVARVLQTRLLVVRSEMRHTRLRRVGG